MLKKGPWAIKVVITVIFTTAFLVACAKSIDAPHETLPTYFSYSDQEIQSLRSLTPTAEMTLDEIYTWQEKAFEIVGENKSSSSDASKFYAYLMTAQKDAAFLSFKAKGEYVGSFDEISNGVFCEFYPDNCPGFSAEKSTDPYSQTLRKIVMEKVKTRIREDQQATKPYPRKEGGEFWVSEWEATGNATGSWKPWIIGSVDSFRAPPPLLADSQEQSREFELKRVAFENLTDQQKIAIALWAGGPGSKREAGRWLDVASDCMKSNSTSLDQALLIRSRMAMGLADVQIAASDSKYTYWAKRPFMVDKNLKTYMPTPNNPSYPSSVAAYARFSATFLSQYFPEKKDRLMAMAEEAGNSRVWSGIHFAIDVEQGFAQGENIAREVIRQTGKLGGA